MPKRRVHEIAKEQGLTSKEVLAALKDAGVYVKAASSTVEERDIRRAFPNGSKARAPEAPKPTKGAAEDDGAKAAAAEAEPEAAAPKAEPADKAPKAAAPKAEAPAAPTAAAPKADAPEAAAPAEAPKAEAPSAPKAQAPTAPPPPPRADAPAAPEVGAPAAPKAAASAAREAEAPATPKTEAPAAPQADAPAAPQADAPAAPQAEAPAAPQADAPAAPQADAPARDADAGKAARGPAASGPAAGAKGDGADKPGPKGDAGRPGEGGRQVPPRGTGPRILDPGTSSPSRQGGDGGGRQRPTRPESGPPGSGGASGGGPGRRRVVIDSQASRRPQGPPPPQQPPRRRRGRRRLTPLEEPPPPTEPVEVEQPVVPIASGATVKEVAETLGIPTPEVIKKLMKLGEMATLTQTLTDEAIGVLADEFDRKIEIVSAADETAAAEPEVEDSAEDLEERPPVVTIMGHVDHGKTSLLDAIRETEVASGEAGGITQHIGAYQVNKDGNTITFIDTPGHQAFTAMRARGAKVTDIAVIVVAADDGVMPQTVEAIDHAKAAGVPIMIAVNKIDKEGADPNRVRGELAQQNLTPADWGGDTEFVDVSAKTRDGLDTLLETVVTLADIQELKSNPNTEASGTVVESQLDPGRGPVATILVQRGTLKVGDALVAGDAWARVRAMNDFRGQKVEEAPPGMPVEVLGFNSVPDAGEVTRVVENERKARQLAAEREDRLKREALARRRHVRVSLEDVFHRAQHGEAKGLALIVKADVAGSLEALEDEIAKLPQEEIKVEVIHDGVGGINESDVMLAAASDAVIIGFNVRPVGAATEVASREGVEIRSYSVIYEVVDDLRKAMQGLLEPEEVERTIGSAEVRATFRASRVGVIAGSYVTEGTIRRGATARLVRDGTVVYDGRIATLRRFKDDVREVQAGFECGITLENFMDVKEGDVVEAYEKTQVERTLGG
jgi:translation initiation factor IF-2